MLRFVSSDENFAHAPSFNRADRIRKALIREISDVLRTEVKDAVMQDKVISVTDVQVSRDFSHAKVFLSMLGAESDREAVMTVIEEFTPRIRTEVGRRLKLRYTTKLVFSFDDSLERGTRVNELLKQIADEDPAAPPSS